IPWRDINRHSLSGASEEHSVRITKVALIFRICDPAPPIAPELMRTPSRIGKTEVSIPGDARPVQFQALYLKLRGRIFKVIAGPRIRLVVQKPMYRININAYVDRIRFEALSFR